MSELLTVKDVATVLKIGEDTVVRRFAKMKGVIDLGVGETRHRAIGALQCNDILEVKHESVSSHEG